MTIHSPYIHLTFTIHNPSSILYLLSPIFSPQSAVGLPHHRLNHCLTTVYTTVYTFSIPQLLSLFTDVSYLYATKNQTMPITIRPATKADAAAIIKFQSEMAWETEEKVLNTNTVTKGVNAVFANPHLGKYYVAEDHNEVIASCLMTPEWSDWRNSNVWWFQSVYVIPAYRRMGVFRKMYAQMKETVKEENLGGLRLYVESNNTRARKTYEAMGMDSEHYTMYEWMVK